MDPYLWLQVCSCSHILLAISKILMQIVSGRLVISLYLFALKIG
jgi:hypothetical protein